MRQWVLKITAYADRLMEDLALVDWPSSTLEMQKNCESAKGSGGLVKKCVNGIRQQPPDRPAHPLS
jgi:hypothetical protein